MSINPLPVHLGLLGVPQEALSAARYGGISKATYTDKLAAARVTYTMKHAAVAPQTPAGALGAAGRAQAPPTSASLVPALHPHPVAPQHAAQLLASPAHQPSQPPGLINSSKAMDQSRLQQPLERALQTMDFASIADTSTGGNGVPRPYGRFTAARGGNGTATWQRLPPSPGSWQARALPLAVTVLTEEEAEEAAATAAAAAAASSSASGSREGTPSTSSHRPNTSGGRSRTPEPPGSKAVGASSPVRKGRATAAAAAAAALRQSRSTGRIRQGPKGLAPATYPGPGSKAQPSGPHSFLTSYPVDQEAYHRRPGSAVHRSLRALPPPEPGNAAWFALPSATFLTQAPEVPNNVRLDCGFSVSRDHLISGLHQPPPDHRQAASQAKQQQQQGLQHLPPQHGEPGASPRARGLSPEHSAPRPSAAASSANVAAAVEPPAGNTSSSAPLSLLNSPVNLRTGGSGLGPLSLASPLASITLSHVELVTPHGGGGGGGSMASSPKPKGAGAGPAGDALGGTAFRGVYLPIDNTLREQRSSGRLPCTLPREDTLPRRNVPPKW